MVVEGGKYDCRMRKATGNKKEGRDEGRRVFEIDPILDG